MMQKASNIFTLASSSRPVLSDTDTSARPRGAAPAWQHNSIRQTLLFACIVIRPAQAVVVSSVARCLYSTQRSV